MAVTGVRRRIGNWWKKLRGYQPPIIKEIPAIDLKEKIEREEWFQVGYVLGLAAMLVGWIYGGDFLTDLVNSAIGHALVGYSWVILAIGYGVTGALALAGALLLSQWRTAYEKSLHKKATRYRCMTGEIREKTETGFVSAMYQFFFEDINEIGKEGDTFELYDGEKYTLGEDEHLYLASGAWEDEDSLLRQVMIWTEGGTIDEHLALKKHETVFLPDAWIGVVREVSKINWLCPQRIQEQQLVLFVTDSYVTLREKLDKIVPHKIKDKQIWVAEREMALTMTQRVRHENEQLKAQLKQSEETYKKLGRAYMRKETTQFRDSEILRAEDQRPKWLGFSGWQRVIPIIIILGSVIGIVFFIGRFLGWW
ncbi:MAG: hypothetical protein ACXADB_10990 [Candidatus Hermodarchaeia archaeon]|jgi:hypothetical protein